MITALENVFSEDISEYTFAPIPMTVAKTMVKVIDKFDKVQSGMTPEYTSYVLNGVLNADIPEDKIEHFDEIGEVVLIYCLNNELVLAVIAMKEVEYICWLLTKRK